MLCVAVLLTTSSIQQTQADWLSSLAAKMSSEEKVLEKPGQWCRDQGVDFGCGAIDVVVALGALAASPLYIPAKIVTQKVKCETKCTGSFGKAYGNTFFEKLPTFKGNVDEIKDDKDFKKMLECMNCSAKSTVKHKCNVLNTLTKARFVISFYNMLARISSNRAGLVGDIGYDEVSVLSKFLAFGRYERKGLVDFCKTKLDGDEVNLTKNVETLFAVTTVKYYEDSYEKDSPSAKAAQKVLEDRLKEEGDYVEPAAAASGTGSPDKSDGGTEAASPARDAVEGGSPSDSAAHGS